MKIIKFFLILVLSIVLIAVGLVVTLTVLEYKPKAIESVDVEQNQTTQIQLGQSIKLMTFNIGYASLGSEEDFVMDGGTKGRPDSKDDVLYYFDGIKNVLSDYPSDFYLLQEVDLKSRRSFEINQVSGIAEHLGASYSTQFAYNFKAAFVPFPLSFTDYIGYVESGLSTFTTYRVESSTRYQFPGSFSWPLRVANLKRAMMVSTHDIEGTDAELFVVNLHMSAYDGDGTLREQEMAFLKDFMVEQHELGNYVIIGGDFNQTFPEAVGIFEAKPGLYEAFPIENDFLPTGFSFMIDTTTPSCRLLNQPYDENDENTQYYIIDGFILSDNITVLPYDETQTVGEAMTIDLDFEYSDHHPVVINVELNG